MFPIKFDREELVAKRPDACLFMLAYEKFQYAYNLEGIRTFAKVFHLHLGCD